MNKISHLISLFALTFFVILAIGSTEDSGSSTSSESSKSSRHSYSCDECGRGFSGKPYQCIFYVCQKSKSVSSALGKFCSCSCGISDRRRAGFDYDCR